LIEIGAPITGEAKDKAIEKAVAEVEKAHGKGSIFDLKKRKGVILPSTPTGIYEVDYDVLGIGGLPKGRIVEIYGPESGGKTTLALQVIAQAQKRGGKAAFADAEHALDPKWAGILGVNVDELLVSQPDYGEQALDIVQILLESKAFDVIVVDSVAALVPKTELDGDIGDAHVGLQARMMSQAMRKLTGLVSKSNTVLIFINQIREKIGVTWGSPETTSGGRALKFAASVRLDVRRIGAVKDGEAIVGNKVKIKAAKNKVSAPFREAEVELLFERGFDGDGSLFDVGLAGGFVEKSGSWYSYKGDRIAQGRLNAIQFMREHDMFPKLLEEVRVQETSE
jgi:recombination protein RecA